MSGGWLALPLLVARIFADDAHYVFALYDAAAFAKAFDGCSYFHDGSVVLKNVCLRGQKIALGTGLPSAISSGGLLLPEGDSPLGQVVGADL